MNRRHSHSQLPKSTDDMHSQLKHDLSVSDLHHPFISSQKRSATSLSSPLLATSTTPNRLAPIATPLVRPLYISAEDDAQTQRQTLADWVKGYSVELGSHQSSIVVAEILLRQIKDGTKELLSPNPLRTAGMCCIVEQMLSTMPRHTAVLRPVMKELYESIYLPVGTVPTEEYVATSLAQLGIGSTEAANLQHFLCRKPYFESLRETAAETSETLRKMAVISLRQGRGHHTFNEAISKWQQSFLRCILVSWHASYNKTKKHRYLLNSFFRGINRRDCLQTHLYAWRAFAKDMKLEQTRREYQDGIEQVIHLEAVTNGKYLEAEDAREELHILSVRQKEEKERLIAERKQFESLSDLSISAAEGWRTVCIDIVNFLASLRKSVAAAHKVSDSGFTSTYELSVKVVLGWAVSVVSHLPMAAKLKASNFGHDLKEGTLIILVLHVVSDGAVSLAVLERKDIPSRMQVVLDALNALDIHLFMTLANLTTAVSPDMFYLVLFSLWNQFALPPLPDESVCVGYSHGYRSDLTQTRQFLDLVKAYYPVWFENRGVLQQYALYLAMAQSKGSNATVAANEQAKAHLQQYTNFKIPSTIFVPSVFLSSHQLNHTQTFQNEEELSRVNEVINRHLSIIMATFDNYSYCKNIVDTVVTKKTKKKVEVDQKIVGTVREMDAFCFYRFCGDCGLLKNEEDTQQLSPTSVAAAKKKILKKDEVAAMPKEKEPTLFFKLQCFELFTEMASRFRDVGAAEGVAAPGDKMSMLAVPKAFSALLLNLAVHRFGQPVVSSSMQPAPGSAYLERLINTDLAPRAAVPHQYAFIRDLFEPEPQAFFVTKRSILQKFFNKKASMHGGAAMTKEDWAEAITAIILIRPPAAAVLESVFTQVSQVLITNTAAASSQPPPAGDTNESSTKSTAPAIQFIVYGEFEIGIAALAVMRDPNPFATLRSKLIQIVDEVEPAMNHDVFNNDDSAQLQEISASFDMSRMQSSATL